MAVHSEGSGESTFDAVVTEAVEQSVRGAVMLIEVMPPWPLQVSWLEQQVRQLCARGLVHRAAESMVAVVVPDIGPAEAWAFRERFKERATVRHMRLFVGCATWPMQGVRAMDLVAAAAAGLLDEHTRHLESLGDEVLLEVDGCDVPIGVAGELLTG